MSKKYIIELDDGFQDNDGNMLYKAIGTKSLVFDEYGINHILTPYKDDDLMWHLLNIDQNLEVYFNNKECRKFIEDRLPLNNGKFNITQFLLSIGAWKYAMTSNNLSVVDYNNIPAIPNENLIKGYNPTVDNKESNDDVSIQQRINELVLTYSDIHEYVFSELKKTYPSDVEFIYHQRNRLTSFETDYLSRIPVGEVCDKIVEFLSSTHDDKRVYRNLWNYYTDEDCRDYVKEHFVPKLDGFVNLSKLVFTVDDWERQGAKKEGEHKHGLVGIYSKDFIIACSILNDYPDIRQFVIINLHDEVYRDSDIIRLNHADDDPLSTYELQFLSSLSTDVIYDEIRKFFEQCDKHKYHNMCPLRLYFTIPECKEWVDDNLVVEDNMIDTNALVSESAQWLEECYNTLFNNKSMNRILNAVMQYNDAHKSDLNDLKIVTYMVLSNRRNIREWVIDQCKYMYPNAVLSHHEDHLTDTERQLLSMIDIRKVESLIVEYLDKVVPKDKFTTIDQLIFYYFTEIDCMNGVHDKLYDDGHLKSFTNFIQEIVSWIHDNNKLNDINWGVGQVELINFMLSQADRKNFINKKEDE